MNKISIILGLLAVNLFSAQKIRYVKEGGAGAKDGTSWANASDDLQAMLNASVPNTITPAYSDVVYVAKGTYRPTVKLSDKDITNNSTTTDRDKSFLLKPGIRIYGGFVGNFGESLESRNFTTNKTILSGDLDNNDVINANGSISGTDNNAYHVLVVASTEGIFNTTQLDGLVIQGGNANGPGTVVVNNIWIYQGLGGGVYTSSQLSSSATTSTSSSSIKILNCTINYNAADTGAGVYSIATNAGSSSTSACNSSPLFINSSITNNYASYYGGGLFSGTTSYQSNAKSEPGFFNCTISNNTADQGGGGVFSSASSSAQTLSYSAVRFINSILWGNKKGTDATVAGSDFSGYTINNGTNEFHATNSILQLDQASSYNSASSNQLITNTDNKFNTDPKFVSPLDFRLKTNSPAKNAGNNTYVHFPYEITKDLYGNDRILEGIVDMGAYEFNPALGVNDLDHLNVEVYPNPVVDFLIIKMAGLKQVSIYTFDGKLMLKSEQNNVNLSSLASGVYVATIETTEGKVVSKKIVKK